MKTFKDIKTFEKKLEKSLCWEDYIKIGGKVFKIFEYGGGSLMRLDYDYVYFYNKRSKIMIYVKYDCPSYKWENGVKVKTKDYRFIGMEIIEEPYLWRTDTL